MTAIFNFWACVHSLFPKLSTVVVTHWKITMSRVCPHSPITTVIDGPPSGARAAIFLCETAGGSAALLVGGPD